MFKLIYNYLFIRSLYKEKLPSKKKILIISIIFLFIYNFLTLTTINKNFIIYITTIFYYQLLLNNHNINYYLIALFSLIGLIVVPNKFITIIYLLIIYILKRYLIQLINYLNNNKKILFILVGLSYIFILINLLKEDISLNKLSSIIMMLSINLLLIYNIEKSMKLSYLNAKYQELKLYSKNNDILVSDYRSLVHENKNQLIIIKGMIFSENKELERYLSNLIDNQTKVTNKWLNDLKYIPIPGIKNFINYKLIQLEKMDAIIEIYISKELEKIIASKIAINELDNFYTIIGVLLDNIIDSVREQKEKLVSINVYMEQNITNIELANTYQDYIDINKLNSYGYTTKGNDHGVGLYLVNKIIKYNKTFELYTKIDNKFFVQHLKIHHPKSHLK